MNITDQNIDDIICTAFEGGINYWCRCANVADADWHGAEYASDVVSRGGTLFVIDDEDPKRELLLTKEKMIASIPIVFQRVMDKRGAGRRSSLEEWLDGEYDAGDADMIIQQALFGEIIYG